MIRWLIALPLLAACINIPKETAGDDDAAAIDASPDGRQLPVCVGSTNTPMLFSQVSGLNVHTANTADLNGDGCDDLVVLGLNREIYISYAPFDGSQSLIYHESLTTQSTPLAIEIADVIGDAQPDVIVFGIADNPSRGLVEVFEGGLGSKGDQFDGTFPQSFQSTFQPQFNSVEGDRPVSIVVGDFYGNGKPLELAIADLGNLAMMNINVENLDQTIMTDIPPFESMGATDWNNIQQLIRYPTENNSGDALMVIERNRVLRKFPSLEVDSFQVFPSTTTSSGLTIETAQLHTVDGNETPDLIGGSVDTFGAYLRTSDSVFNMSESSTRTIPEILNGMWQLKILPSPDGDEIIIFERIFQEKGVNRLVTRPLRFSNSGFSMQDSIAIALGVGFNPIAAVVADLDNDGIQEYQVISIDGKSACYVPGSNGGITPCTAN